MLKPASRTPIGALIIGEVLAETDLPKGAFSVLPAHRDGADLFTTDERFKLLSFTGSPAVGWALKEKAGKKKVVLELGGNAAAIVDADQRDQLDYVVERLAFGAYYQSGQSCIGVQRILVHADLYDALRDKLIAKTRSLKMGDPKDPSTFVGPMISESESRRLSDWMDAAVAAGAKIVARRQGRWRDVRGDAAGKRRARAGPVPEGGIRPRRDPREVRPVRRRARARERQRLRAAGRRVHRFARACSARGTSWRSAAS